MNLNLKPEHVKEWITRAAIRDRNGKIYTKDRPARHGDIIYVMSDKYHKTVLDSQPQNQGFLTNTNRFVSRHEAKAIALSAGQVKDFNKLSEELFTEDLW